MQDKLYKVCFLLNIIFLSVLVDARVVKQGEAIWLMQRQSAQATFDVLLTSQDLVGGTFIINKSGTYGLAENVTITSPIIIQSDSVVLNLNSHTITINGVGSAIACTSHNLIQVINGTIIALNADGIDFTSCNQLLLESLNITTMGTGISITLSTIVEIRSCTIQGTSSSSSIGIVVDGTNYTVEECFISNFLGGITSGTFAGPLPIEQFVVRNVEVVNCNAGFGFVAGNLPTGISEAQLENCTATSCTVGFALDSSCKIVECIAQNCFDGFFTYGSANDLQSCIARNNTHYGFTNFSTLISSLGSFGRFINCVAMLNQNDGFSINNNNNTQQISGCLSYANGGAGYRFTGISSVFINNVAYNNSAGNFIGTPASTLVATNLITGVSSIQALDATYWWNVTPT